MPLPDIEAALSSFQRALDAKEIALQRGAKDKNLYVYLDTPNGEHRLTYVRLMGRRVTAMTQFIRCDPYKGEPCFNVAWSVPVELRGSGRAVEVFNAAVAELSNGLKGAGISAFWVEAIVGVDNLASQRVASIAVSTAPTPTKDAYAGVEVLQYLRRVDSGSTGSR